MMQTLLGYIGFDSTVLQTKFIWILFIFLQSTLCLIDVIFFKFNFSVNESFIIEDQLKEEHSKFNLAHWMNALAICLVEYVILARYSVCGYKNNVRANLRIFSAISLTLFIGLCFSTICDFAEKKLFIANLTVTHVSAVIGLCVSAFMIERSQLYKKWELLENQKIKVLDVEPGMKKSILQAELILNMIEMEMWSHNSFRNDFDSFMKSKNKKVKSKKNAYKLVKRYQTILIKKQKRDDLAEKAEINAEKTADQMKIANGGRIFRLVSEKKRKKVS